MLRQSSNLFRHISDDIGQLLHDQVDAFDAGLFKSSNLLLHDGLKGHVRCKETDSDT